MRAASIALTVVAVLIVSDFVDARRCRRPQECRSQNRHGYVNDGRSAWGDLARGVLEETGREGVRTVSDLIAQHAGYYGGRPNFNSGFNDFGPGSPGFGSMPPMY